MRWLSGLKNSIKYEDHEFFRPEEYELVNFLENDEGSYDLETPVHIRSDIDGYTAAQEIERFGEEGGKDVWWWLNARKTRFGNVEIEATTTEYDQSEPKTKDLDELEGYTQDMLRELSQETPLPSPEDATIVEPTTETRLEGQTSKSWDEISGFFNYSAKDF